MGCHSWPVDLGEPERLARRERDARPDLPALTEVGAGSGNLIVCSLDLDQNLCEGRYLLAALSAYGVSDRRGAGTRLSDDALKTIAASTRFDAADGAEIP